MTVRLQLSQTGGWNGQYEYQLQLGATVVVPYSTNSVFNNLTQGTYTVYVRDVRGCVYSENIILTNPTAITANAIATQTVNCFGDQNMSITVTGVTGGQGSNYTYTLNTLTPVIASSGPQSSNVFNNLGAGTYEVIIHDGWSCASNPIPVTILPRTQVQASVATVANSQQCADSFSFVDNNCNRWCGSIQLQHFCYRSVYRFIQPFNYID